MFMEPIEIATAALEPAPRRKATVLKLVVGLAFLGLCAVLMLPWTLLVAAWFGLAVGARAVGGALRGVRDLLLFSGETVLGR